MFKRKNHHHKILVIGMAKSGTSALTYKIAGAFTENELVFEPGGANGLNDFNLHREICSNAKKNLIVKNICYPGTPNIIQEIASLYSKVVWIVRDPRDRMISAFLYQWNGSHNPNPEQFERGLKLIKQKETNPESIAFYQLLRSLYNFNPFGFIISQSKLQQAHLSDIRLNNSNTFVFKYEDMIDNNFEKLEEYLGFKVKFSAGVPDELSRVVRTKAYGNWRNWFTNEDTIFFRALYFESLYKLGYDPNDWKLNNPQIISPEEGSEYMKRIFNNNNIEKE